MKWTTPSLRALRRRDRGPRLRRRRGSGGSDLAHEAVLVELRDELLELRVEALADLLRHLAQRGAAVDGREHRAVCALEKARLAGSFLDALARLRIDRARLH
jgi:hypothetical protein